jgi:hypothetical protein
MDSENKLWWKVVGFFWTCSIWRQVEVDDMMLEDSNGMTGSRSQGDVNSTNMFYLYLPLYNLSGERNKKQNPLASF